MTIFYPLPRFITNITNAKNAVVTFTDDHGYKNGQVLSFRVNSDYGMRQINEKQGKVIDHDDTTVTVNIETTCFDAFIYPVPDSDQYVPVTIPVGSGVLSNDPVPMTNIECTFDNRPY